MTNDRHIGNLFVKCRDDDDKIIGKQLGRVSGFIQRIVTESEKHDISLGIAINHREIFVIKAHNGIGYELIIDRRKMGKLPRITIDEKELAALYNSIGRLDIRRANQEYLTGIENRTGEHKEWDNGLIEGSGFSESNFTKMYKLAKALERKEIEHGEKY